MQRTIKYLKRQTTLARKKRGLDLDSADGNNVNPPEPKRPKVPALARQRRQKWSLLHLEKMTQDKGAEGRGRIARIHRRRLLVVEVEKRIMQFHTCMDKGMFQIMII